MKEELIKLLGLGKTKNGLGAPPEPMSVPSKTAISYAQADEPGQETPGSENTWTEVQRTYHADKLVKSSDGFFTIKFKPVDTVVLQNPQGEQMTLKFLNQ